MTGEGAKAKRPPGEERSKGWDGDTAAIALWDTVKPRRVGRTEEHACEDGKEYEIDKVRFSKLGLAYGGLGWAPNLALLPGLCSLCEASLHW